MVNETSVGEYHSFGLMVESREIFLGSESNSIGESEESAIDYKISNKFIKNLHILNRDKGNILVHLNLVPGGEWYYGLSMYDSIITNPNLINAIGYGHLASMSTILFQAFNHRVLMPNCSMMLHWGNNAYNPHPRANISQAEWMESLRDKMMAIYVSRCKYGPAFKRKSKAYVIKKLTEMINNNEDLYLDCEECIYYGLADGILGQGCYSNFDMVKNAT